MDYFIDEDIFDLIFIIYIFIFAFYHSIRDHTFIMNKIIDYCIKAPKITFHINFRSDEIVECYVRLNCATTICLIVYYINFLYCFFLEVWFSVTKSNLISVTTWSTKNSIAYYALAILTKVK